MSSSIYDIPEFIAGYNYKKYDFIKDTRIGQPTNGMYLYRINKGVSLSSLDSDINNWGGIRQDNGEYKQEFIWKPSYDWANDTSPRLKILSFGDGYSQISADGINNILINLNLVFNNLKIDEYTAILHFLSLAGSTGKSFLFTPPEPRNKLKRFICKKWQDSKVFFNNYKIQATFDEAVV